jgi:uncharacterized membrane protein YcaP (DUF421 family)
MSAESEKTRAQLSDYQRILLGDAPALFLAEVLVRTVIIFFITILIVRLMGKRMGGQISNLELSVMLVLGAVVSMPMQSIDAGLLPAIALLMMLLGLQRLVSILGAYSEWVEQLTQGKPSILVRDGVLSLQALRGARVSRHQLFSTLRSHGVRHLGELKRVYLESGGVFSLIRATHARPGLSVAPEFDDRIHERKQTPDGVLACARCGALGVAQLRECSRCHARAFVRATGEAA